MRTLFVFAHQDDEYAIASIIARAARRGDELFCAYLTNGRTGSVSADRRNAESLAALADLGVPREHVAFIGTQLGIDDGSLPAHLEAALDGLASFVVRCGAQPERIYTLAWEGGHQDHDAAHLVVAAFATQAGIAERVRQFPIYHGYRIPAPFFRTLAPLERRPTLHGERLSLAEAWRNAHFCWHYPSQRRTWIGLFPQSLLHFLLRRALFHDAIDPAALERRPHPGALLYERMGRMEYAAFEAYAAPFRAKHLAR